MSVVTMVTCVIVGIAISKGVTAIAEFMDGEEEFVDGDEA